MIVNRREFVASLAARVASRVGAERAAQNLEHQFADVPNASRLTMHWYIFGPAWTVEESRRELDMMRQAHIGGVLIFPTYPVAVDDPGRSIRNQRHLSPEFLDTFRRVTAAARKMGLHADAVIGTGWPYGGPTVTLEDAAKRLRRIAIQPGGVLPPLKKGEELVAVFDNDAFVSGPTLMEVKRAALGGEGLVLDHYSRAALERYLDAVGRPLVEAAGGNLRSVFCDSLEVYRANWTGGFPEIFRVRRSYDLLPFLPALFDASNADAKDVRADFWRTLSELATQEFVLPLQRWAHRHGVSTQVQSYGTPPVSIASYQHVDVPTGEHYEWKEFNSSRWASSGAHLAGKPVILAEAWTWLGLPNRFADTLEQLKRCSDLHFLSGVNSLYGVTYAYSPPEAGSPGWVPYFGPHVNHTVPFWPHLPPLVDYVNRVSHMLQQGEPVADVALYLPVEDAMAEAGPEQLLLNWAVRDRLSSNGPPPEFSLKNALHYESDIVKGIITNGYSFDGIDTFVLASGVAIERGRLRKGHGDYAVVVLPNLTAIDVRSLEMIAAFVRSGGIVIAVGRLPETAWGISGRERNRARVRELVAEMFGTPSRDDAVIERSYGRGRVFFARDTQGSFLEALRSVRPDIHFAEPSPDVSFVHRRTSDLDIYFLANTGEREYRSDATFRVGRKQPQFWDPRTAQIADAAVFETTEHGTRLPLRLGPFESALIVFRAPGLPPAGSHTNLPRVTREGAGWKALVEENGTYFLSGRAGRKEFKVDGIPAPLTLAPRWKLQFEGGESVELGALVSWTEIPKARFFSGRATYEAEVEVPETRLSVRLDLGRVHESAEVYLNDQPAGILWMRPYTTGDISALLRPGKNRLRIVVANLLINKVLGMGPVDYSAVYAQYGRRFPAGEEWDLVREPFPSGLLGPVRLVFSKEVTG